MKVSTTLIAKNADIYSKSGNEIYVGLDNADFSDFIAENADAILDEIGEDYIKREYLGIED